MDPLEWPQRWLHVPCKGVAETRLAGISPSASRGSDVAGLGRPMPAILAFGDLAGHDASDQVGKPG
jgi:hypothetical protein